MLFCGDLNGTVSKKHYISYFEHHQLVPFVNYATPDGTMLKVYTPDGAVYIDFIWNSSFVIYFQHHQWDLCSSTQSQVCVVSLLWWWWCLLWSAASFACAGGGSKTCKLVSMTRWHQGATGMDEFNLKDILF